MDYPRKLYHYTSIESLALILKNKTIRFNSLDKMDDLQENKSQDIKNLGRLIFVSSWTELEIESIPMWKMYTDMKSGIRIALPSNPFIREKTRGKIVKKPINEWGYTVVESEEYTDTFLDIEKLNRFGVFPLEAVDGNILNKINYTNDKECLEPKVLQGDAIILDKLGRHKSKYWDFQKEWRYTLYFLATYNGLDKTEQSKFYRKHLDDICKGEAVLPISYFDLTISDEAFKQMEILKSPKLSIGNEILLETLVKEYNPSAKIICSDLCDKL